MSLAEPIAPHTLRPTTTARPLIVVTWLCVAGAVLSLTMHQIDGRLLDDEAIWLKPLKFHISMAVHAGTVTLALALLGARGRRAMRWPAAALAGAIAYEAVFLPLQAARGVRSHFNDATPFDAIGGAIMTLGAGVLVTVPVIVGATLLAAAVRGSDRRVFCFGAGLGLILGGGLATWSGMYLGANNGPFVGVHGLQDPTLPLFGWSRVAGDYRIAHFTGLHAMQAVFVAGWAAERWLRPGRGALVVVACGATSVAVTAAALFQAHAGQPFWPLP